MKALTLCLAVSCLATTALAQTKPAAKPTAKPAAARTTTAAKPTAKPAAKPVTTAKPAPTARPTATATVAPVSAKPAPATKAAPAAKASAAATTATFGKGTTVANLGVGLGLGTYNHGLLGGSGKSIPAVSLSVEHGVYDGLGPGVIGVGGLVGYKSYTWRYGDSRASWRNIYVGVRGTYHYNFTDNKKLDTYAGLAIGSRIESYSYKDGNGNEIIDNNSWGGTYVTSGLFVGARYYLTDQIGGFAEVGYDMSLLKLGVSARF